MKMNLDLIEVLLSTWTNETCSICTCTHYDAVNGSIIQVYMSTYLIHTHTQSIIII